MYMTPTGEAEVKAMARAAHTFSRLSVRNLKQAEVYPRHREECLVEARRLRTEAYVFLAWARRTRDGI